MEVKEIWKDIPDYEGLYQVSNMGRVKALEKYVKHRYGGKQKLKERMLIPYSNNSGYLNIKLSKENKYKHFLVHRLVLLAFVPNPENKPTGNHKDGVKADNYVSNLEWATYKENQNHAKENGLNTHMYACKKVKIFKGNIEKIFDSARDAARYLGCNLSSVNEVCNKNRKTKIIYGWEAEYI